MLWPAVSDYEKSPDIYAIYLVRFNLLAEVSIFVKNYLHLHPTNNSFVWPIRHEKKISDAGV